MNRKTLSLKNVPPQGIPVDVAVERICENCRWLSEHSECRQRPPYINEPTGKAMWPRVDPIDWCAQFKRLPCKGDVYHGK